MASQAWAAQVSEAQQQSALCRQRFEKVPFWDGSGCVDLSGTWDAWDEHRPQHAPLFPPFMTHD